MICFSTSSQALVIWTCHWALSSDVASTTTAGSSLKVRCRGPTPRESPARTICFPPRRSTSHTSRPSSARTAPLRSGRRGSRSTGSATAHRTAGLCDRTSPSGSAAPCTTGCRTQGTSTGTASPGRAGVCPRRGPRTCGAGGCGCCRTQSCVSSMTCGRRPCRWWRCTSARPPSR